jgi:hypothetical protein
MGVPLWQRRSLWQERKSRPLVAVRAKLCHLTQRGLLLPQTEELKNTFCVHDPAWWWVKASNLGRLSGLVVRFNLARVLRYLFRYRLELIQHTLSLFFTKIDYFRRLLVLRA